MKIRFRVAASGSVRVIRGGSWNGDPALARVADRDGFTPDFRWYYLGFRLLLIPEVRMIGTVG